MESENANYVSTENEPYLTVTALMNERLLPTKSNFYKLCSDLQLSNCKLQSGVAVTGSYDSISKLREFILTSIATTSDNERIKKKSTNHCQYFCSECPFKTARMSALINHRKLHQKGCQMHKCRLCSFSSFNKSYLIHHQNKCHNGVKELTCAQCQFTCFSTKTLSNHTRIKHSMSTEEMKQLLTDFVKNLEPHNDNLKAKPKIEIFHQCPKCSYKTSKSSRLVRHVNAVHNQIKTAHCSICNKDFTRIDTLRNHNKSLHGEVQRRFQCSVCSKKFRSNCHLKDHMDVHRMDKTYLCSVCGYHFKSAASLRKHQKTIHDCPKSFQCDLCNKDYSTNSGLKRHQKSKFHADSIILSSEQAQESLVPVSEDYQFDFENIPQFPDQIQLSDFDFVQTLQIPIL